MVLMGVREWEEAASERRKEKRIQSGKLKRRLPEQAVEGGSSAEDEGRGGVEEKKVNPEHAVAPPTYPHTARHPHFVVRSFPSEPIHRSLL